MKRDEIKRPSHPLPKTREQMTVSGYPLQIQITDDGSRTLIDPASGVAYHSASGAATETRHVYLRHSGVQRRLDQRQPTSVLEIGLGTSMAMLMTVDAAQSKGTPLDYTALENNLVSVELLRHLRLTSVLNNHSLAEEYFCWLVEQEKHPPTPSLTWYPSETTRVHILRQSVVAWANASSELARFDAIYFDPFAPEINPELWDKACLRLMQRMLKPGGCLTTYCVSRAAREAMAIAGFQVKKVPGPPMGKREVLVATKCGSYLV